MGYGKFFSLLQRVSNRVHRNNYSGGFPNFETSKPSSILPRDLNQVMAVWDLSFGVVGAPRPKDIGRFRCSPFFFSTSAGNL